MQIELSRRRVFVSRRPIQLNLSAQQREELESVRARAERSYLRERAAALLKIADGQSGMQVATRGLLKPRKPQTIYEWVRRYQQEGIRGLEIRAGRGRKPAFPSQA